jgi:PAS domain S-box-containing protein
VRSKKKIFKADQPSLVKTSSKEQLNHSEQFYRFLFENNPFPACIYDIESLKFLEVNPAAVGFYGYSKEEFSSMIFSDIRVNEEPSSLEETSKTPREGQAGDEFIWKHRKKNGEEVYVEVRANNFTYNNQKALLVMITDVTAVINAEVSLKRTNEEYRLANERYDIVANATHDLIWDWNLETNEVYRDPKGLRKVYGIKDNENIKHINDWIEKVHHEDLPRVQTVILRILNAKDENIFDVEYRFRRENGDYAYIYDRGYILRNKEGKAYRMIGAAQDVTEKKRLEDELLNQQKAITQATISTQEKERTEISKELHDNVNQVLTTTKLYLDLAIANPELKDELIAKSSKNIISVITEIRKLSQSLMIPSLEDLGLLDSIEDLVESINATKKIHAVFVHEKIDETVLNENQKLTLFRITQEALNNIVRHANATRTTIELSNNKKRVQLTIKDNGKGFDSFSTKKGAGLNNIRNRVYLLSGQLTINTHPGKGCALVVELPHHRVSQLNL